MEGGPALVPGNCRFPAPGLGPDPCPRPINPPTAGPDTDLDVDLAWSKAYYSPMAGLDANGQVWIWLGLVGVGGGGSFERVEGGG